MGLFAGQSAGTPRGRTVVVVPDSGTPDVTVGGRGAVVSGADVATGNAVVAGASVVSGSALVSGAAVISGAAVVRGDPFVTGDAVFGGAAVVAVRRGPVVSDAVIGSSVGDGFGGACAPAGDVEL